MSNLTNSLLMLQEPVIDVDMAGNLFYGLHGVGGPNDLLNPGDNMPGETLNYFDLGLGSMPGVKVEGL